VALVEEGHQCELLPNTQTGGRVGGLAAVVQAMHKQAERLHSIRIGLVSEGHLTECFVEVAGSKRRKLRLHQLK